MTAAVAGREMHNELLDQLESINQWWPDGSQASISALNAREVLIRLTELRVLLKEHIRLEETQGLVPNGASADPRFARQAEQLLAQHGGLWNHLNAVISSVPLISESAQAWSNAKGHFDDFRKQLEAHERSENDLFQAAIGDNLGVSD